MAAQVAGLVRDKKYEACREQSARRPSGRCSQSLGAVRPGGDPATGKPVRRSVRRLHRIGQADAQTSPKRTTSFPIFSIATTIPTTPSSEARTALSMDPKNAEAYRYLGLALYSAGRYDCRAQRLSAIAGARTEQRRRLLRHGHHAPRSGRSCAAPRLRTVMLWPAARFLGSAQQSWRRPARPGPARGRGHRISRRQATESAGSQHSQQSRQHLLRSEQL